MTKVLLRDCQHLGYCARSMRPWFVANGLDYVAFVQDGLPEETLLALDDDFATRAVAEAHRRLTSVEWAIEQKDAASGQ